MTNTRNDNIQWQGLPLTVRSSPLHIGEVAPQATLVGMDLREFKILDCDAETLVLSVVPSLDTKTCNAQSLQFSAIAREFSEQNVGIISVSVDLPFAINRWCDASRTENLKFGSDYKYRSFGTLYGVYMEELGLLARAVFIIDGRRVIRHVEYVCDLGREPDYAAAVETLELLNRDHAAKRPSSIL